MLSCIGFYAKVLRKNLLIATDLCAILPSNPSLPSLDTLAIVLSVPEYYRES